MSTTTVGRGESYMNLNPLPTQDESRTYGVMSDKQRAIYHGGLNMKTEQHLKGRNISTLSGD
jgi:hypothetical protein